MTKIEDAIQRIRKVQCPTGELQEKVAGILQDYQVAKKEDVSLYRQEQYDKDGALGYIAEIHRPEKLAMKILARSGAEDYVAQVIEVDEITN